MTIPGGVEYFVTFIDDHSRKNWIYFLRTKDDVFDRFKEFKVIVENMTGRKIKIRRPSPKTPVDPIFELCMTFLGEECVIKALPLGSSDSRVRSLSKKSRCGMMYEACRVRMLPSSQVRAFQKRTKRDVRRH